MKHLLYLLISILLFSCNNDDCEGVTTVAIVKQTHMFYSQYGNTKTVTYYEDDKPVLDTTFYSEDSNSAEIFQSKRDWSYNNIGLVSSITKTDYQGDERITEISYDSQQRISLINHNNMEQTSFVYNGNQIIRNYLQGGTNFTTTYELDQNNHLISETIANGMQVASVQYDNDGNISQHTSPQVANIQFSYLQNEIPDFMKHLEFGSNQTNYILYVGSLNYSVLVNLGANFTDQISHQNTNWVNTNFVYQFNNDLKPTYIKSVSGSYTNYETFIVYD